MSTLVFVDPESSTQADGAQSSRLPVPFLEDPYEAIRQAYLVGTDTESKPFEDLRTESPESPHIVVSPVGHVEESENSETSGVGSTSSDSTTPLSPDHPLTHDTPVLVKMDDPNITMEEYIKLEEEKARRHVFYDAFTSEVTPSCEPTVSPLNNNKIDFGIPFDESDDEDYTVIYDKNSFSYKIISVNDLKTDSENDNDKVNMPSFPSPEPTGMDTAYRPPVQF
ncbi:hypothetical protein Tco_0471758 [Tanacetum coccineum]